MDEVMIRMRASVMATPVSPAMVVNMVMVGLCNHRPKHRHKTRLQTDILEQ